MLARSRDPKPYQGVYCPALGTQFAGTHGWTGSARYIYGLNTYSAILLQKSKCFCHSLFIVQHLTVIFLDNCYTYKHGHVATCTCRAVDIKTAEVSSRRRLDVSGIFVRALRPAQVGTFFFSFIL
jgi:hypothetical protein